MSFYSKDEEIDGRYVVINQKGGGGFGKVLKVLDKESNQVVALKYCNSDTEDDILRFKREVRKMSEISHRNIISILSSNTEHDPPYFTMPLAQKTVAELIETELHGDLDAIVRVFDKICAGITMIHGMGHTHRDIKPENALVLEDGEIVVSDLGLIKKNERDTTVLTKTNVAIGSEAYAPPEIFMPGGTRDMDHRGDIFMLGKTLYKMFTNMNPLVLNSSAVPPGLWIVIRKATRQNPSERYQSVGEMQDALHDIQRALSPEMNYNNNFEVLLTVVEEHLKQNEYNEVNVRQMLQILNVVDDQEDFLELFHKIPTELLRVIPEAFIVEFELVMEKYYIAIKEEVGGMPFSFADVVAHRMSIVFAEANSSRIKRFAIMSILKSGVSLNRFAAMDSFDSILESIKDDDVAFEIAEGLKEDMYLYRLQYHRIPRKKLHPAIQNVWDSCFEDLETVSET